VKAAYSAENSREAVTQEISGTIGADLLNLALGAIYESNRTDDGSSLKLEAKVETSDKMKPAKGLEIELAAWFKATFTVWED
jgi:hypothetical protein